MTTETMTVAQAIETSVRETRIVHLAGIEDASDLLIECEDSVQVDGVTEYWGTTADGGEWRVHLTLEWYPADMGGGTGDGSPLTVSDVDDEGEVAAALCEWLAEGDWGHDDGADLVRGCGGRARRNDWAADGSRDVDVSIWVRRSTGKWGRE